MMSRRDSRRTARRLFRACLVGGRLDETRVRQATARLAATRPRQGLAVLEELHRLIRTEITRWNLHIESAILLPSDRLAEFEACIASHAGGPVETTSAVNPSLIGGLRLRLGSDVWDGSVAGRLARLGSES